MASPEPVRAQATLRRDGRASFYLVLCVGALFVGIATGSASIAAVSAVPLPLLISAFAFARPLQVSSLAEVSNDRLIEGDRVAISFSAKLPGWAIAEVTAHLPLAVSSPDAETPIGAKRFTGYLAQNVDHPESHSIEAALIGHEWGRHAIGPFHLLVHEPFGLFSWHAELNQRVELRVLPAPERLTDLLAPAATRITSGVHLAKRQLGHGMEFAEIRAYQPGDRLRDLNWAATARHRTPHVNRFHPELAGEVIVLVDTTIDRAWGMSAARRRALLRTTAAAWSIAQVHLAAQDRVGLLATGTSTTWLEPRSGIRAKYQVFETLMEVSGDAPAASWEWARSPLGLVPSSALVIMLTPLWESRMVNVASSLRYGGRNVVVAVLDVDAVLDPPVNAADVAARQLFDLTVSLRMDSLRRNGVPAIRWGRAGIETVIPVARHLVRHHRVGAR